MPGLILLRVPVLNSAVWSSTRLRATWAGHPRPRAEAYTRLIVERRFMFKDRHRRELSVSDTARVTGHGRKAARRPQEEQGLLAPASRAPPGPQDRPYLFNRRRRSRREDRASSTPMCTAEFRARATGAKRHRGALTRRSSSRQRAKESCSARSRYP